MKKLVATLSLLFSFTLLYSSTTYAITSGGGRASTSTSTSTSSSVSSSSASRSASTSSSMSASRSSSSASSNASRSSNTRSTNSSMNRSTSSLPPSNRNYSSSSRNNYNSTSSFLPTQNMLMWFLIFNSIQSEEQQRNILQEKAKKQKGNMYVLHVKTKDGMKLLPVSKNDYNKVKEWSKVEFKNNQLNIK